MHKEAIALLASAAIGVGACGDDEDDKASTPAAPPAPVVTTTTATTATTPTTTTSKRGSLDVSKDLSSKPEIPQPSGDPPTKLVKKDIVVGKGRGARSGDQLVMHYVGVLHMTGEQFDASWDKGQPFPFTLGKGEVIPGWDQGIEGMKVGGRRLLIIPPDLAYGEAGQGSIPPDATLVFAVDLLNVTPGGGSG